MPSRVPPAGDECSGWRRCRCAALHNSSCVTVVRGGVFTCLRTLTTYWAAGVKAAKFCAGVFTLNAWWRACHYRRCFQFLVRAPLRLDDSLLGQEVFFSRTFKSYRLFLFVLKKQCIIVLERQCRHRLRNTPQLTLQGVHFLIITKTSYANFFIVL